MGLPRLFKKMGAAGGKKFSDIDDMIINYKSFRACKKAIQFENSNDRGWTGPTERGCCRWLGGARVNR
jgi:hypothetical protein